MKVKEDWRTTRKLRRLKEAWSLYTIEMLQLIVCNERNCRDKWHYFEWGWRVSYVNEAMLISDFTKLYYDCVKGIILRNIYSNVMKR